MTTLNDPTSLIPRIHKISSSWTSGLLAQPSWHLNWLLKISRWIRLLKCTKVDDTTSLIQMQQSMKPAAKGSQEPRVTASADKLDSDHLHEV